MLGSSQWYTIQAVTSVNSSLEFDYVVVGGGTAGCIVAWRLAQWTGDSVCLIERGASDEGVPEILELRRWAELLKSQYDYDYPIAEMPRGNNRLRHSRGKMLGGCSSHNSAIAFRPPDRDFDAWQAAGADGWGPQGVDSSFQRVLEKVNLEFSDSGNACVNAFLDATREAGFPQRDFRRGVGEGAGLFLLNKLGPYRQSSSVAYLHPLHEIPENLHVLTNCGVSRLQVDQDQVRWVESGAGRVYARREFVLSCGAFDSPRLLMLSGIGPRDELNRHGIEVRVELAAVGQHLLDHPEAVMIWEAAQPVPQQTAQNYEAGLFARSHPDLAWPDTMFHFGTEAFDLNTLPLGYPTAENAFSLTPNVMYARSEGEVRLNSLDPADPPWIQTGYFSDGGHDEQVLVKGLLRAREIARQPALQRWVSRELAPGVDVIDEQQLSDYARQTVNTVYHPAGTCRMGAAGDEGAVVTPELFVRGLTNLRIADASVFPRMVGVNPCLTCMMIGEKCAELMGAPK